MTSRGGTSPAVVASIFVHGLASWRPVDIGDQRGRAGGDHDRRACEQELVVDEHPSLSVQAAAAAYDRDAALLEPRQLTGVVQMVDHLVPPPQDRVHVQRPDRETRNPFHLVSELDGPEQRLRGHAGVERALSSDEPVLDDRHGEPVLAESSRRHLAGSAGADHHHVELAHVSSRGLGRRLRTDLVQCRRYGAGVRDARPLRAPGRIQAPVEVVASGSGRRSATP